MKAFQSCCIQSLRGYRLGRHFYDDPSRMIAVPPTPWSRYCVFGLDALR